MADDEPRRHDAADLRRGERGGLRSGGNRAVRSERHLGRLGRAGRAPVERARLRRLQVGGRRQEMVVPRPREDRTDWRDCDPPARSADGLRRGDGPSVGTECRARRLQDDRRRQYLAQGALRRRHDRLNRRRDRSARFECPLRNDLAAPAFGRCRDARVGPRQRHLQEHGRRRALDAADERAAE